MRLRLGLPQNAMQEIHTCVCGGAVDFIGLHHLHCKTAGNLIVAHNAVRNSIGNLCQAAGYSVQWEVPNELLRTTTGPNSRGAITDLVLQRDGVKTLLDVTIRDPCCPSMVDRASKIPLVAAKKGETEKNRKYATRPPHVHFVPAAFESFGAWGEDFSRFFSAVARTSREPHHDSAGQEFWVRRMKSKVSSALAMAMAAHLNAKFTAVREATRPTTRHGHNFDKVASIIESLLAA